MKGFIGKYRQMILIAGAFLLSFIFFQFAYSYHLIRREQQTLFLYDLPYIFRTYGSVGFLSRFLGDFLEQFFCFKILGPVIVSALLTSITVTVYYISRQFIGKKLSLIPAFLFYAWAFLRETGTNYITQYTISVAGILLLVLLALKFKSARGRAIALPAFLVAAYLAFGIPYHSYYGKPLAGPDFENEKLIALEVETIREDWDKVLDISKCNLMYREAGYIYNLATAMKGQLSERLLKHPQDYANNLFLFVTDRVSPFTNGLAGEVWYHLGNMTLADQSAMVSMQFSPKHTGARYIVRLAMINLVSGEYGSAEKYLGMLSRTLNYRKWARNMMPVNWDEATREAIAAARANAIRDDVVSGSNNYPLLLGKLLEANPNNAMAREYLLCYDLLTLDLDSFMEDRAFEETIPDIYQEATLIWLNIKHNNNIAGTDPAQYGVSPQTMSRLDKFYLNPYLYKTTYWYYYMNATEQ